MPSNVFQQILPFVGKCGKLW